MTIRTPIQRLIGTGSTIPAGMQANQQLSEELVASLQSMLQQMLDKTLRSQVVDKSGKPTGSVSYLMMPMGTPVDPKDFANPWTPAGADTASQLTSLGTRSPQPATSTSTSGGNTTPQVDTSMQMAIQAAANTAALVDTMLAVTKDGEYLASESQFEVSQAYEAIVTKAQGQPAPPPPKDIQDKIDAARRLLWVYDDKGNNTGQQTQLYSQYEQLSAAWGGAQAAYAAAEAQASTNPAQAAVWPVTSKALKVAVDNAWHEWRSAGADEVENALDTLEAVGGAIGAHLVAEARELLKTWDIGLSGAVAANTYYSHVMPSSFWDPTDNTNGFTHVTASSSTWSSAGSSASKELASSWFTSHSEGSSGGGGGMIFGVVFGGSGGGSSSDTHSGEDTSGYAYSSFSSGMSNVSVSFWYGLCTIYRPWLLAELFASDGWYLPGEKAGAVSTGDIDDQLGAKDPHLLPMIPSQFLVVRDVAITASNWGEAGDRLAKHSSHGEGAGHTDSSNVGGAIGFLCFGAEASHDESNASGSKSSEQAASSEWHFSGSSAYGTLTIPGSQIVGWVGQIVPRSPKVDSPPPTSSPNTSAPSTSASH